MYILSNIATIEIRIFSAILVKKKDKKK